MASPKKVKKAVASVTGSADIPICLPDREAKIAELAYLKAENRGFEPGQELEDWFAAEQEFSF